MLIVLTFEVSEREAEGYAAGMVALAEDHGGHHNALNLDWSYRIKKDLGETGKLRWRSEEERTKFENAERQRYAAWDVLISGRRPV